jgi:chromate transporter
MDGSVDDPARAESPSPAPAPRRRRPSLRELFRVSSLLGLVGFGGGISVLGSMRSLLIVKRRWLTEREFVATSTVAQMLPGGAAANALAYTGLRFHGTTGAVVAYTGFIAPGALIVTAMAALYVHVGVTPAVQPFFAGMNAAVVGVIAAITLQMARTGIGRPWQMGVAAAALLLSLGGGGAGEVAGLGVVAGFVFDLGTKRFRLARFRRAVSPRPPPVALPDEGGRLQDAAERALVRAMERWRERRERAERKDRGPPPEVPMGALAFLWLGRAGALGALAGMGLAFVRAGLGAYGGGFAIIPSLQAAVLDQGWLTPQQFADAVAIGKITPGPVLLMATFIGYVKFGLVGAAVATLSIFAAPLAIVVALGGWIARVRSRRPVRAALRGLTPAVVGLMTAAAITLGGGLVGPAELAIAAATVLTLVRFEVNPVWILFVGGAARLGLHAFGV